jgi:putative endonuclease
MPYYVYILLCEGDSFYTGYTKNLKARIRLHEKGKAARYTRMHKPKRLVYVEKFQSRAEAMKRERKIKKMNHLQKLKLHLSKPRKDKLKRVHSPKYGNPL